MGFTLHVHRSGSVVLLAEAATIEMHATGGSTTVDAMKAVMSGRRGSTSAAGFKALIAATISHIVLTALLATIFKWSFTGS